MVCKLSCIILSTWSWGIATGRKTSPYQSACSGHLGNIPVPATTAPGRTFNLLADVFAGCYDKFVWIWWVLPTFQMAHPHITFKSPIWGGHLGQIPYSHRTVCMIMLVNYISCIYNLSNVTIVNEKIYFIPLIYCHKCTTIVFIMQSNIIWA